MLIPNFRTWIFASAVITALFLLSCDRSGSPVSRKVVTGYAGVLGDTTNKLYGKAVFSRNCMKCHKMTRSDDLLNGVVDNLGERYLRLYITSQDSLLAAREPYAMAVKKQYGTEKNHHNFNFSEKQLSALIAFLR